MDDLAVLATRDRLHLVSVSRQQVIEPQVFHALALDKQPPPLARFLAHLPRAFSAAWHEFDWGKHAARLPYLPRVRLGRSVLSPARWRLTHTDVPADAADQEQWQQALAHWRARWHCPNTVELRDADRTLRLDLNERAHTAVLRAHLRRHPDATLTETVTSVEGFGWIDGHAHEIALPLVTRHPPAPSPLTGPLPVLANRSHGHLPASPDARWLYAKIYAHPERHSEIIAGYLPQLLIELDGAPLWWFVRYRSPHEADHLRLRIHADQERFAAYAAAVGHWADHLRDAELALRLAFDTYYPETGRYGPGAAAEAAETAFAADSAVVMATLQHLSPTAVDTTALTALNMVEIAQGLLGTLGEAMAWLTDRPAPAGAPVDRAVTDQVIRRARLGDLDGPGHWPVEVTKAWQARTAALKSYRNALPDSADTTSILESLLHMHHNRALGINRDGERACRRLARQAALAWHSRQDGADQ